MCYTEDKGTLCKCNASTLFNPVNNLGGSDDIVLRVLGLYLEQLTREELVDHDRVRAIRETKQI